jgi:outer membrane receptor protein involved in Fe transport
MTFSYNQLLAIKATIIIALLSLFSFTSFSQKNGSYELAGRIIDSLDKQPIEYVSVAVYGAKDNKLITGSTTNPKGEFTVKGLIAGGYIIKSSFIGYKTRTTLVEISNNSVHLSEPIALSISTVSLNEVQVSSKRNERQVSIEKTRIDVARNISSISGNITDVLKSQSSINIDAENKIYLRGNGNILILIDGRPTTLTTLSAIPSSTVENIEIITNPDAKYDAEGTGGIINVVTKKQSVTGMNGAVTLNYGINNRINGGFGLNYSKGIWDLGVSYNGSFERTNIHSTLSRELYSQNILVKQNISSEQVNPNHIASFMASVKPNSKNMVSWGIKLMSPKIDNTQKVFGTQFENALPSDTFNRRNEIEWSRKIVETNLSYKKVFEKTKHEISFDALFSKTKGSRPASYYLENELIQKSSGGGTPTNITLQIDYLKQIFNSGRMELGVKGFSRWNDFTSNFYDWDAPTSQWVNNSAFSNDLKHKEYIYSSYLMYSDSLLKKISYKMGARIEYNTSSLIQKSTDEESNKSYLFPFPYLQAKYNITPSQSVALSVNRRVTRPTYPQLNPFIVVVDQMTYETGNKNLKPEIVDKIEFNHSWVKEKYQLKTNLYYSRAKDYITQITTLSASDKLIVTYVNGSNQNKAGIDLDATYNPNKIISFNSGISVFYTKSSGSYNGIDLSTENLAWTGNIKTAIKLDKKTELQLLLNYNSPIALPQFDVNEVYYADIALKRNLLKNRLALNLTVTDVFDTRKWNVTSDNSFYRLSNQSKNDSRIVWFGIVYTINNYSKAKDKKENGESERSVIKLGQ